MKKFKMKFPVSKAEAFSDYAYANEIRIVIAYTTGGDFFDTVMLNCICHAAEDKATAVMASDWKQYVQG